MLSRILACWTIAAMVLSCAPDGAPHQRTGLTETTEPGQPPTPGSSAPASSAPTPEPHGGDLVLEATRTGPERVLSGTNVPVEVWLINSSTTKSYTFLKPADGSSRGLREPSTYFEREQQGADHWEKMPRTSALGCGLFDTDVTKDIVTVEPGQRLQLEWIPSLSFPADATGHFRARYAYRVDKDKVPGMRTLTLTSNPIIVHQIPGPLELELKQISPLHVAKKVDPATIFSLTMHNRSAAGVEVNMPGRSMAVVGFEIDKPNGGIWPKGDRPTAGQAPAPSHKVTLASGKAVTVLGPGATVFQTPGSWTYPVAETFRIRAVFSQPFPGQTTLYSNWVTVSAKL